MGEFSPVFDGRPHRWLGMGTLLSAGSLCTRLLSASPEELCEAEDDAASPRQGQ